MAKGRKLTTSRSERLLSGYSYSNGYGSSGAEASELREEDIWEVAAGDDHEDENTSASGFMWSTRISSRDGRLQGDSHGYQVGGLSLAFQGSAAGVTSPRIVHQYRGSGASPVSAPPRVGSTGHHHMATSAPVNVPDWSKIYRVDSVGSMHDLDDGVDDQELGGSQMVPPHEYLCARTQKTGATSVFEGVGRTLKGRDMSRVRDAVWSHTGFDG